MGAGGGAEFPAEGDRTGGTIDPWEDVRLLETLLTFESPLLIILGGGGRLLAAGLAGGAVREEEPEGDRTGGAFGGPLLPRRGRTATPALWELDGDRGGALGGPEERGGALGGPDERGGAEGGVALER